MHPRSLRHGKVNDCVATWATVVVVPAIILRENWALPPPVMPAMAKTATGLQMGGLRTTRARRASVPAKDAFIWGQSTPLKQTGMLTHACHGPHGP